MNLFIATLMTAILFWAFAIYKKWVFKEKFAYENGTLGAKEASKKWHKREMLLISIIYAEFFVYNRFLNDLVWQDWCIIIALGSVCFTIFINVISLYQKWNYVGKESEWDKKYGKWFLIKQLAFLGISILLKILIK